MVRVSLSSLSLFAVPLAHVTSASLSSENAVESKHDTQIPILRVEEWSHIEDLKAQSLAIDDHAVAPLKIGAFRKGRAAAAAFDHVKQALESNFDDLTHPFPPPVLDFSDLTIAEILNATLNRESDLFPGWHHPHPPRDPKDPAQLPLYKLAHIINKTEGALKQLEKDSFTLLAPDDWALTPPHHRTHGDGRGDDHKHRHGHKNHGDDIEEAYWAGARQSEHPFLREDAFSVEDKDEDKDREKRKRFERLVNIFLSYHILPENYSSHELADKSTVRTTLGDQRIKISSRFELVPFPHPTLAFNYLARKRGPTVLAKNGVIHLVSSVLFPPLDMIDSLYLVPQVFSTLTSDVQRLELDEQLHVKLDALSEEVIGDLTKDLGKNFTVFAPTNKAFRELGFELNAFLHLPFPLAKKVLTYVYKYHIVPGVVFYSDHISPPGKYETGKEIDVEPKLPLPPSEDFRFGRGAERPNRKGDSKWRALFNRRPENGPNAKKENQPLPMKLRDVTKRDLPIPHPKFNVTHYELPTLLENATLRVDVVQGRKLLGKGSIERIVLVLPAKNERGHDDEALDDKTDDQLASEGEDDSFLGTPHPHDHPHHGPPLHGCRGRRPIRVFIGDNPAANGAIHAIGRVIRPPRPTEHSEHAYMVREETTALFA